RDTDRAVDLSRVVSGVVAVMRAEAERRHVGLEFIPPSGSCLVEGGEEAATDIVSNLVVNAIEAGAPEGTDPSHQEHPEPKVTVSINGHDSGRGRVLLSAQDRSEEHTSELQSRFDLVCRLLLEKKNTR